MITTMQKQLKKYLCIKKFDSTILTTITVDNKTGLKRSKEDFMEMPKQALIHRLELQGFEEVRKDNQYVK